MFLKILCISHGSVQTALQNCRESSVCYDRTDRRGKKSPPNKTKPELIKKIKKHIEIFPTRESHYRR